MPLPQFSQPNILFLFQGILVLSVNEGRTEADLGIIKDAKGHNFAMGVLKYKGGSIEHLIPLLTKDDLRDPALDVNNKPDKGIHLYKKPGFKRKPESPDNDRNDFCWIIDLESEEIYGEEVKVEKRGFRSIFRMDHINNGLFFTAGISKDELVKIEGDGRTVLGRVATGIGANIPLDNPSSVATFKNGEQTIRLQPEEDTTYIIFVIQSPATTGGTGGTHPNHSVLFDQAIKGGKHSHKKISFERSAHKGAHIQSPQPEIAQEEWLNILSNFIPLSPPEAECFNPNTGKTKLRDL